MSNPRRIRPERHARIVKVCNLLARGYTPQETADALGVKVANVYKDREVYRVWFKAELCDVDVTRDALAATTLQMRHLHELRERMDGNPSATVGLERLIFEVRKRIDDLSLMLAEQERLAVRIRKGELTGAGITDWRNIRATVEIIDPSGISHAGAEV